MQKLDFLVPGRFVKDLASKNFPLFIGLKKFFQKNTCLVLLNNIS